MERTIEFKGFQPSPNVQKTLEESLSNLERRAGRNPDARSLRLEVELNGSGGTYTVSLDLRVDGKTLEAREQAADPETALKRALADAEGQWREHRSAVRAQHLWEQIVLRAQRRRKKGAAEWLQHDMVLRAVRPHLNVVSSFVQHEIAYAVADGDLRRGDLVHEDVLYDVLIQAYKELDKHPRQNLRSWLVGLAAEAIESAIKQSETERVRSVHLEEDIPEIPAAEEVSTLGDEVLDFFHPDEDLRIEDIVPDLGAATPEQQAAVEEMRANIRRCLARLARETRRLLLLRFQQGLGIDELARITKRTQPEIETDLESARRELRRELIAAGYSANPVQAATW